MEVILLNCSAEIFDKEIQKGSIDSIDHIRMIASITDIINSMTNYKLCYDVVNDIYYTVADLKEMI